MLTRQQEIHGLESAGPPRHRAAAAVVPSIDKLADAGAEAAKP